VEAVGCLKFESEFVSLVKFGNWVPYRLDFSLLGVIKALLWLYDWISARSLTWYEIFLLNLVGHFELLLLWESDGCLKDGLLDSVRHLNN